MPLNIVNMINKYFFCSRNKVLSRRMFFCIFLIYFFFDFFIFQQKEKFHLYMFRNSIRHQHGNLKNEVLSAESFENMFLVNILNDHLQYWCTK